MSLIATREQGGTERKGLLAGLRVIDLTSVLMGPYCTQIMADLGADVIKVESPEGDSTRHVGPGREPGLSGMFINLNRSKRSVVLDLKSENGRNLLLRLVESADVFIHAMRPDAITKLRLTYADVKAVRDDIVYCNLFGFGRGGEYSGQAAYDDTIQSLCGLASLEALLHGAPAYVPTVVADKVSALTGVYAVAFALYHRAAKGEGQEVDVAMFEAMTAFTLAEHMVGATFVPPMGEPVYGRAAEKLRRPYRTIDGYLSVLVYNDKQYRRFIEIVARPEYLDDPRFAKIANRIKNISAYYELIQSFIAERSSAEWLEVLERAGIPVARVNSTADLFSDPHLKSVDFFEHIVDKKGSELCLTGRPFRFSAAPHPDLKPAPELGEHTREIMAELGLSETEIRALETSWRR